MKHISYIICLIFVLLSTVSCEKDLQVFDDPTCRLNFYYNVKSTQDFKADMSKDSYSFIYSGDKQKDTVWVTIESMGMLSNVDRPITLEQEDTTAVMAVPGKHYVAFNDPSLASYYIMPKGMARTRIPIVVLRDPSLKKETVTLKYSIKPNEYFENGYSVFQTRVLAITDRLSQPSYWTKAYYFYGYPSTLNDFIGNYGPVKHQFMIDVTGKSWDDDFIDSLMTGDSSYRNYIIDKLIAALEKTNDERKAQGLSVLSEEDGTPVSFN